MNLATTTASERSIFGDSPEHWTVDRIRDRLGVIVAGEWGDEPDAHDEGIEIPVVRVADIRGLDVTTENLTVRRVKESKLPGRLIGKRTLLLEKSGGGEQKPVGRAVLGRKLTVDAICSNFMAKTDCMLTVAPTFVAYLLDAAYSSCINTAHIQQTTGIQNLRVTDYLNTKVAFPPLAEQERIAAYLDASCTAINAAVVAKRRQLETLDALRKSVTLQAVTQGLNPNVAKRETEIDWIPRIPAHWKTVKLSSLFWFQKGARAAEITQKYIADSPGEFPVFSGQTEDDGLMGSIDSFEFDFDSPVIFVTTVGAKAMTTRLVTGKFSISQNCALIIPWHRKINLDYFLATIQELFDFERRSIALIMQPSLRFKDMKKFRLPFPPPSEQAVICTYLYEKLGEAKRIALTIESQIATLTAYRKSLIHECATGQRRVTENDLKRVQVHG
ncbi:MAG: restriction endonuclease subunit S [Gemmatimonadota bacterium]|nr:restriction endonuclease subunit S [Gemmatimonadota bacterium]